MEKKILNLKKLIMNFLIKLNKLSGQALHAKTLEFIHPNYKKMDEF